MRIEKIEFILLVKSNLPYHKSIYLKGENNMAAIVHRYDSRVEKSDRVVYQQLALNKHWLPDVLIDIIKDYLYTSKEDVLHKYYRYHLNKSIQTVSTKSQICVDMFNRSRLTDWHIWCKSEPYIHLQGTVCNVCGVGTRHHQRINAINGGVCSLVWDDVDFAIDDNGQHHIPIMKIGWMNMPHGTRGRFE